MELRLSDRHIIALNMLLVAVLAYFAALAVNDVVLLRRAPVEAPIARTRGGLMDDSSPSRSRAAYQAIVERDIFNLEPPPVAAPEVVVEDLHLTLIGVSQTTAGKPFAIVADATGQQSVYRVGEMIPGSGKLLEVDKDQAIVEHGGKHVVIALPKDDMTGGSGAVASSDASPSRLRRPTPLEASSHDESRHRSMRHRRY
jgi:type II secretory pathway component PulC